MSDTQAKQENNLKLSTLQKRIGWQFKSIELFEQALTHKSFHSENNERLEFLGDSVLNTAVTQYLYQTFPDLNEGVLSRVRSHLVKGETLAKIAQDINLGDFLNLGIGERKSGGFKRTSILADAIEAIIGAVFLDSNFDKASEFVLALFGERLSQDHILNLQKDSKTALQEYVQARQLSLPEYEVLETIGKEHEQSFKVKCRLKELDLETMATASSRRSAEKKAARLLLEQLPEKEFL